MTTSAARLAPERVAWSTRLVTLTLLVFGTGLLAIAIVVFVGGLGYYTTPWEQRLEHPLDKLLRPGSGVGLWMGIAGTALMLSMLSYTVRKFFLGWSWLGSPTHWLRFHIICGVMGPAFIILHTAFMTPSGLIATGFWCMVLVAVSGVFGRYVYGHFPRTAAGRSEELRAARDALADLRAQLVAETSEAGSEPIAAAITLARDLEGEAHSILDWIRLDLEVRRRRRKIRDLLRSSGLPAATQKRVARRLGDQLKARRNVEGWSVTGKLFQWWHLFHEPLAKAMYIIAAIHIFQAVVIGGALNNLGVWPL